MGIYPHAQMGQTFFTAVKPGKESFEDSWKIDRAVLALVLKYEKLITLLLLIQVLNHLKSFEAYNVLFYYHFIIFLGEQSISSISIVNLTGRADTWQNSLYRPTFIQFLR